MKKAILLSGIFALSVLAGCQTNEKSSKTAEDVKKIEENTEEKGKEDAKKDKKENNKDSIAAEPTSMPTSFPVPTLSPHEGTISKPSHAENFSAGQADFCGGFQNRGDSGCGSG